MSALTSAPARRWIPPSNGVRARDPGTAAGLFNPVCAPDPFPAWPVADAGWEHLHEWIAGGDAPPGFSNSLIARNDMGNALGTRCWLNRKLSLSAGSCSISTQGQEQSSSHSGSVGRMAILPPHG